jgi:DNA polymerase-1
MLRSDLPEYEEVWAFDFEFEGGDSGDHYRPACVTAFELRTGREVRLWRDQLGADPPYRTDSKALFLCYGGTAECGSHLALGWPLPANLIDLMVEFRNLNNGRIRPGKGAFSLIGALTRYGLPAIAEPIKKYWTGIAMRGPPWTEEEKAGVLTYCFSDTTSGADLFLHMLPALDMKRALLRGEFSKVSARMEFRGAPIDMTIAPRLRDVETWDRIRKDLIPPIDEAFGVYVGRTFTERLFESYLAREEMPWPRHPSGRLDLREKTFREMSKSYPQVAPLHELRHTLAKLRRIELRVGSDGRARTVLWPCQSKTSRTQPSASKYIFGPSCWLRSLIKPGPGRAIAYVDWSAMEFGIAGALSGDTRMMQAYAGGQPYIDFAISFGAAPPGATKRSHPAEHELYKVVCLGAQYGMQAETLAMRLGISAAAASEMLRHHHHLFARYWQWSDETLHRALSTGQIRTVFGWTLYLDMPEKELSIRNFLVQAHGAEILRLTCILADKYGLGLCCPVHDALLLGSPESRIDRDVELLENIMRRASRIVLNPRAGGDFVLRADAKIVRYPDRYTDRRGERMWDLVTKMLDGCEVHNPGVRL